ncbi:hypothetical protein NL676_026345 [Syzygium grande]|nr:hypothetical protein NL676_026345 [Syzygium grande]
MRPVGIKSELRILCKRGQKRVSGDEVATSTRRRLGDYATTERVEIERPLIRTAQHGVDGVSVGENWRGSDPGGSRANGGILILPVPPRGTRT